MDELYEVIEKELNISREVFDRIIAAEGACKEICECLFYCLEKRPELQSVASAALQYICNSTRMDDDWITVNGTHVLVSEEGVAKSGGNLKGKPFSKAQSSKKTSSGTATADFKTLDKEGMKRFAVSYKEWADNLSGERLSAVQKYVAQHSALFNHQLRTGQSIGKGQATAEEYKALDDAIENSKIPEDVCLFRGASEKFFGGKDPESFVGKTVVDKGYVSTTMGQNVADTYSDGVICKISCKAGSRGAYVDEVGFGEKSDFGIDFNNEILLPRNSSFTITDVKRKGNGWEVEMTYED